MYKTTRVTKVPFDLAYSSNEWNMRVPIIEMLLREIDPEGVSEKRHRLRRIFHSLGPNYA